MRNEGWNPLLKSYPDSEKINRCSIGAEMLYTRLIAQSDDLGHYYGDAKWISAKLLTARTLSGEVTTEAIEGWLTELKNAGLIEFYEAGGIRYLELVNIKKCLRRDVKPEIRFPVREMVGTDSKQTRPASVTNPGRVRYESGPLEENRTRKEQEESMQPDGCPPTSYESAKPGASTPPADAATGKTRKPPSEPTGNHAALVKWFCDSWEKKYGEKYPFLGGKDGEHVKWILNQVNDDLERAKRIVTGYLASEDEFFVKDRHGLGTLKSQFRRFITAARRSASQAPRSAVFHGV